MLLAKVSSGWSHVTGGRHFGDLASMLGTALMANAWSDLWEELGTALASATVALLVGPSLRARSAPWRLDLIVAIGMTLLGGGLLAVALGTGEPPAGMLVGLGAAPPTTWAIYHLEDRLMVEGREASVLERLVLAIALLVPRREPPPLQCPPGVVRVGVPAVAASSSDLSDQRA